MPANPESADCRSDLLDAAGCRPKLPSDLVFAARSRFVAATRFLTLPVESRPVGRPGSASHCVAVVASSLDREVYGIEQVRLLTCAALT